ncbi:MAG: hypothetical protein LBC17_04370, partial [Lactobacillaceae bacterium]|nr:hypothetical protein [Lactobacillaceae bacterium]
MQLGIGSAGAKTILFGEHSVVYGYPSVAIPLKNFQSKVVIQKNKYNAFHYNNQNIPLDILKEKFTGFFALIDKMMQINNIDKNIKLLFSVTTDIPSKSG